MVVFNTYAYTHTCIYTQTTYAYMFPNPSKQNLTLLRLPAQDMLSPESTHILASSRFLLSFLDTKLAEVWVCWYKKYSFLAFSFVFLWKCLMPIRIKAFKLSGRFENFHLYLKKEFYLIYILYLRRYITVEFNSSFVNN